jgi:hypothetical protein
MRIGRHRELGLSTIGKSALTIRNRFFDERKIVVLRSDAPDKTAKQNESDDHFRLADHPGVDTIFVNTSAFIGSNLPTGRPYFQVPLCLGLNPRG